MSTTPLTHGWATRILCRKLPSRHHLSTHRPAQLSNSTSAASYRWKFFSSRPSLRTIFRGKAHLSHICQSALLPKMAMSTMCKFTPTCLLVSAAKLCFRPEQLIRQQNGPPEIDLKRSNGRTAPPATLHTISLPGRRKQHSANRAIKLNGVTGTTRHRVLTV